MAADRSLAYTITVNDNGTATIKNFSGQVIKGGVAIDNLDKELMQLNTTLGASANKFKIQEQALIKAQNAAVIGSKKYNQLGRNIESLRSNQQRLIGTSTTGLTGVGAASGGAATSVLELGRVVSDAPYGIRGMANNVSQLASNMLFTAQQVDKATGKVVGFGGVLKQMGKTFIGPLGILFAIQAVISAVDYFYGSTKKAELASDDYKDSIKELTDVLNDLYLTQDDVNKKIDEYVNLVVLKNKIDKEQKENAEELAKVQKKITENETNGNLIKEQRLALEKRGIKEGELYKSYLKSEKFYEDLANKSKQERNDIIKKSVANLEELRKKEEEYKAAKEGTLKALDDEKKELLKEQKVLSDTSDKYKEYAKQIAVVQKAIDAITGGKKRKGGKKSEKDLLTENIFSLEKEESDYYKRKESALVWNENKLLRIKQEYEQDDLKVKYEGYVDKENARIDANDKELAAKKISHSEWLANDKLLKGELTKAEQEYYDAAQLLADTQAEERKRRAIDNATKEFLAVEQARRGGSEQAGGFGVANDSGVDSVNAELELEKMKFANKLFFITEEIKARKKAGKTFNDLTIKKANFEAENEQNNYQLKRKLESAKLAVVSQGLQFAIQVAEEGSGVGKAAAVAMATISTYEAATAALGAKPYGPWNIAQAAIVTAMGIANVKKIIDTKTPGDKGGGAAGGGGRTFDFNLAGSTGQNQLAQTIGGQVAQPIKTYVVSSEITNQQQFDNQIQGEVTIG